MEENKNCGCGGCGCGEHEHTHADHECGCHGEEESVIYVTFEDEDQEVPCSVLDIFECDGREYIALVPQDEVENADEAEVLFYRFSEDGEEVKLDEVETDEEWEKVAALFDEIFFGEIGRASCRERVCQYV